MMRKSYLLLISIFLFLSIELYGFDENIIPDPLNYQEMPFDVLNYDVKLDLRDYKSKKMEGICKITVLRKEIYDGDYFIFHLKSLNIDNISSNEKILNYTHQLEDDNKFSHYRVEYPDQISDTVVFEIAYSGTMSQEITDNLAWGGVYYEESVLYSISAGISAPYVSTARHWMPCFDLPQDKATFRASFTVPNGFLVASNGLLVETKDIDEASKEFVWQTDFQTATYLLTFASAPYILLEYSNYDVPIEIYSLRIDSARSEFVYRRLPEVAECYSNLFGDYPFEKIGYCNTTKGAMEHQTMISLPRSILVQHYSKKDDNNLTIVHELAHQWFGNLVSPKDFRDVWLNESFANYSEALWENCRAGEEAYLQNIIDEKDYYLYTIAPYEGILPIYDFPRIAPSFNYPTTIYAKGSVVLGMLYYELERNNISLSEVLKDYLEQYKFSNINTAEFIEFINNRTGLDLDWFFEQWVYSAGWAKLEIDLSNTENDMLSSKFTIKQVQENGLYKNLPVEISYYIGDETHTIVELISDEITEINLGDELNFQIDSIQINTGKKVVGLFETDKITSVSSDNNEINLPYQLNQSGNQLTINYQSKYGYSKFVIYDMLGNIIFNEENNSKYGMNSFRFNFNKLQSSVYFINLAIDNTIYTEKISIIQ